MNRRGIRTLDVGGLCFSRVTQFWRLDWAGEDVVSADRFEPEAGAEMGVDADGTRDAVEVEFIGIVGEVVVHQFHVLLEDAGDFLSAAVEEAHGMGVAVEVAAVADAVFLGDFHGAALADKIAFDGVTVRMGADDAADRMAVEVGRSGGCGVGRAGSKE
jgi:hypothetical protein